MTTYQTPIVVGIFQDEAGAKNAIDALRSAGFAYDQVGVAIRNSGTPTQSLGGDLMNLGVSPERANYYESEYNSGRIVISVRPDGRDDEVKNIMRTNGAYDYNTNSAQNAGSSQQTDWQQPAAQQSSAPPTDTYGQAGQQQPAGYRGPVMPDDQLQA